MSTYKFFLYIFTSTNKSRRYDEGTAYLPVVQNKRQVPVNDKYNFIALDVDGYDLPSDW